MKHLFKFGKKACASMAWVTLFLGATPWVVAQESYPNKPIRMLLGYPPGGGSDIIARLVAKPLGDRLGQSVVVDNKPGAGGNIAAEMVARATPDGYTLLFVPSGLASSAAMKKTLPFQPVNDFIWISTDEVFGPVERDERNTVFELDLDVLAPRIGHGLNSLC